MMSNVRTGRLAPIAALALALTACAGSPPARYYTLQEASSAQAGPTAAPLNLAGNQAVIEVLPVSVPVQVDQPQIMLRDRAGAVTPLYSDRWSAPLADEMRSALSDRLTRRLGVADVYEVKAARGQPVWRIQVDIQRFDSVLGDAATLDATWRLRAINMKAPASLCRTQIRQAASGADLQSLVAAHQAAVAKLGDIVASRVAGQDAPVQEGVSHQCSVVTDEQRAD